MDTACSSSLVALQLAGAAILPGTASAALAGGVNLLLAPETTSIAQKAGMLSRDGRCKALDAAADGYGRGEACGLLLLASTHSKWAPTSHRWAPTSGGLLGFIVGAAVGQDGRSSSLTAPNGPAQQNVIRSALQQSTHSPHDVGNLQMHGTGTSLGDPIEVGAASAVFTASGLPEADGRSTAMSQVRETADAERGLSGHPLVLMASKSWVGHSEPASGVTSMGHALAALTQAAMLPSTHLRNLNPYVASAMTSGGRRSLHAAKQAGPLSNQPSSIGDANAAALAGVSSFAFQGTNAHLVLQRGAAMTDQGHSQVAHGKLTWRKQRAWAAPRAHPMLISTHMQLPPRQVVVVCRVAGNVSLSYLHEHMVTGRALIPGAAFFIAASAAGQVLLLEGSRAPAKGPGALQQAGASALPVQLLTAASIMAPCQLPAQLPSPAGLAIQVVIDTMTGQVMIASTNGGGDKPTTHMQASIRAVVSPPTPHLIPAKWVGGRPSAALQIMQGLLPVTNRVQAQDRQASVLPAVASIADGSGASEDMGPARMDGMLQLGAAVNAPGGLHVPTGLQGMSLPQEESSEAQTLACLVSTQVCIEAEIQLVSLSEAVLSVSCVAASLKLPC